MNADARQESVAVVGERSAETIKEFLAAREISAAKWFSPSDLDDVQRAIEKGTIRHVVLVAWDDLLNGVWDGVIDLESWFHAGVQLDFVDSPSDRDAQLTAMAANWRKYQHRRRRRRALAGSVLSVLALAAAFLLIWHAS